MEDKTGHLDIPATEIAIKQLNHYSEQLDIFKKELDNEVAKLQSVHLDPNFDKFYKYFNEFWPEIVKFKKEIDKFNGYLFSQKELINKNYNTIVIKL